MSQSSVGLGLALLGALAYLARRPPAGAAPVNLPTPHRGAYPVTSPFGERRGEATHNGTDYGTPVGVDLYAPFAGELTVHEDPRSGKNVRLTGVVDGWRVYLSASHLSAVPGPMSVQAGAWIGATGNTGHTTGPHVHYVIRVDGSLVDPEKVFYAV